MNVQENLIHPGHPNRPGKKLEALKAIVIHYTANFNPGATDTANAAYFGRPFKQSPDLSTFLEADGKTEFRRGSTQVLVDQDSVTLALPTDEVGWACGDRPLAYTNGNKGQRPLATWLFNGRQNYQSLSMELCVNANWERTLDNAVEWLTDFLRQKGLRVFVQGSLQPQVPVALTPREILLVRHYDVTGKLCPKPFVDKPADWEVFVNRVAGKVNV